MAHTFLDPAKVAQLANALVRKDLVLGATVSVDAAANFTRGKGASVDVKIPATLAARTRAVGATAAITADSLTESYQTITITEQVYNAVDLTDADLTLNLDDFGTQVLAPQTLAVAEYIEDALVTKLNTLTANAALGTAYAAATPEKTFTAARKNLRDLGAPATGLFAVVGTDIYMDLLNSGKLSDASVSGSTGALREAVVGKLAGFTVIESNRVAQKDMFFYAKDGMQMVLRAPAKPRGATLGESVSQDGHAMSWVMDYDASTMQDRSVVSTFLGLGFITIKLQGGGNIAPRLRVTKP